MTDESSGAFKATYSSFIRGILSIERNANKRDTAGPNGSGLSSSDSTVRTLKSYGSSNCTAIIKRSTIACDGHASSQLSGQRGKAIQQATSRGNAELSEYHQQSSFDASSSRCASGAATAATSTFKPNRSASSTITHEREATGKKRKQPPESGQEQSMASHSSGPLFPPLKKTTPIQRRNLIQCPYCSKICDGKGAFANHMLECSTGEVVQN